MSDEIRGRWVNVGRDFAVEVVLRVVDLTAAGLPVRYNWCIYAHISSRHPLCDLLPPDADTGDSVFDVLDLHGGCTWYESHYDPNDRFAGRLGVTVGADYVHYYDDYYTSSPDFQVLEPDAIKLFTLLQDIADHGPELSGPPKQSPQAPVDSSKFLSITPDESISINEL